MVKLKLALLALILSGCENQEVMQSTGVVNYSASCKSSIIAGGSLIVKDGSVVSVSCN